MDAKLEYSSAIRIMALDGVPTDDIAYNIMDLHSDCVTIMDKDMVCPEWCNENCTSEQCAEKCWEPYIERFIESDKILQLQSGSVIELDSERYVIFKVMSVNRVLVIPEMTLKEIIGDFTECSGRCLVPLSRIMTYTNELCLLDAETSEVTDFTILDDFYNLDDIDMVMIYKLNKGDVK